MTNSEEEAHDDSHSRQQNGQITTADHSLNRFESEASDTNPHPFVRRRREPTVDRWLVNPRPRPREDSWIASRIIGQPRFDLD
jgi:hypothetical protein